MHLWRIATNMLPTKLNLSRCASSIDVNCPLCNTEPESSLQLFTSCQLQLAQILWFGCDWGLRVLNIQFSDPHQSVDFIVNPPKELMVVKTQQEKFNLYAALILEFVWQLRKRAVHEGIKPRKEELEIGVQR